MCIKRAMLLFFCLIKGEEKMKKDDIVLGLHLGAALIIVTLLYTRWTQNNEILDI